MNKMGPGIIGSSHSEAYVRAMYAASAERYVRWRLLPQVSLE
ncbi:hypothetical protein CPC735_001490 [Coccidioides posadasii C735 delta SOWgp]|uniref:Uncharacterized protein n=1 Tax=Coccidioides posadasii (strain C735) TaxID=222929 RepID=C5PE71_COCP7|nr:hypothetical protein CPC735_001490 [Coccidioides posadasii C735 delta SOWgp]EER24804.1 hypothetical protein CPC735_001490 [Coccidioides posadasii C735 delta SOWgp]|eukprot:XP_003066949.1 hypothetical protein CPC735_001490 [Coccidioides posadasii C735 delta SOWgp]